MYVDEGALRPQERIARFQSQLLKNNFTSITCRALSRPSQSGALDWPAQVSYTNPEMLQMFYKAHLHFLRSWLSHAQVCAGLMRPNPGPTPSRPGKGEGAEGNQHWGGTWRWWQGGGMGTFWGGKRLGRVWASGRTDLVKGRNLPGQHRLDPTHLARPSWPYLGYLDLWQRFHWHWSE